MTDVPPEAEVDTAGSPARDPRWWLPWAGLAVGVWATLPKYSGPFLNTEASKEVADHVVPGIVVIGVSALTLLMGSRNSRATPGSGGPGGEPRPTMVPFVCGTVVLLAGFWMLATHLPLIVQAVNGDAPWPATIYHSSPALAVFGLGLMWVTLHWRDLAAIEAAQQATARPERDAGASG